MKGQFPLFLVFSLVGEGFNWLDGDGYYHVTKAFILGRHFFFSSFSLARTCIRQGNFPTLLFTTPAFHPHTSPPLFSLRSGGGVELWDQSISVTPTVYSMLNESYHDY